jgi:hypothetical protein
VYCATVGAARAGTGYGMAVRVHSGWKWCMCGLGTFRRIVSRQHVSTGACFHGMQHCFSGGVKKHISSVYVMFVVCMCVYVCMCR